MVLFSINIVVFYVLLLLQKLSLEVTNSVDILFESLKTIILLFFRLSRVS